MPLGHFANDITHLTTSIYPSFLSHGQQNERKVHYHITNWEIGHKSICHQLTGDTHPWTRTTLKAYKIQWIRLCYDPNEYVMCRNFVSSLIIERCDENTENKSKLSVVTYESSESKYFAEIIVKDWTFFDSFLIRLSSRLTLLNIYIFYF